MFPKMKSLRKAPYDVYSHVYHGRESESEERPDTSLATIGQPASGVPLSNASNCNDSRVTTILFLNERCEKSMTLEIS